MKYLRLLIFSGVTYGGYFISHDFFSLMFDKELPLSFSLYGIHNLWAGIACFLWGIYIFIICLDKIIKIPFPLGNNNKILILIAFFSALVALVSSVAINSNIEKQNYVQCTDLTKVATRFTKKVYAKTPQICEQLVKEKYEHN